MFVLYIITLDWFWTVLLFTLTFYLTYSFSKDQEKRQLMPPGPKPWPVIGNLPHIVGQDLHIALLKLSKNFGKMFWLKLAGEEVLVVNNMDAAVACFVRQGKIFSGRPKKSKSVDVMLGDGLDIVMNDLSPELKFHRKIVHSFLASQTNSGKDRLERILLREADSFQETLRNLHQNKTCFDPKFHVARVVANVLSQCILNHRFDDVDEEFHEQLRIVQDIVDNIESFNIVDIFPWLEHLPIPSWRRYLKSLEKKDRWIFNVIQKHRESPAESGHKDLVDLMLEHQKAAIEKNDTKQTNLLKDTNIGHIVHELFGGGIESTTMSILWFILYLIRHPEWQDKIYEEIQTNLHHGTDTKNDLPSAFDRGSFPILEATIKETLRNACVLPIGFPHRNTQETELNGYYIPADSMVIMNIWAIHHDEEEWEDPYSFKPERFLDPDRRTRFSYLPFGIGHRVCLGSAIAKMSIFLFCACLVSKYKFTVPDGEGLPDPTPNAGLSNRPKPFSIKLIER
ncbi:hypothetical protein FSP39_005504 [Pinctada imbricata]|uniref:Cytochrome P450 n=1 Tax=Pinctada imbricata TaxID=66713 RepID=A0AA88Y3Q3_PINIB|nr:hypothetical protein FSP39_005504 [Pinctada imbricata]